MSRTLATGSCLSSGPCTCVGPVTSFALTAIYVSISGSVTGLLYRCHDIFFIFISFPTGYIRNLFSFLIITEHLHLYFDIFDKYHNISWTFNIFYFNTTENKV